MTNKPLLLIMSILAILTGMLCPQTVAGQCDPDSVYRFGLALETDGEYYRAVSEFKRVLHYWPDSPQAMGSRYHIGMSYLEGRRYEDAVSHFQALLYLKPGSSWEIPARYGLGAAFYAQTRYDFALKEVTWLEDRTDDPSFRHDLVLSEIWCHLRKRDPAAAAAAADRLPDTADGSATRSDLRTILDDLTRWRPRKPWLAGIMSAVVPGSGQMYAGRWRDGVISFVINGLFITGCVSALRSDRTEVGVLLGVLEMGWYSANIYNAMNDAHKMNYSRWNDHLKIIDYRFGSPFPDRHAMFEP